MANKKYTLYFKGTGKSKEKYDFPIVSLALKQMDMYTSNYEDYLDLFNCLPVKVSNFIKHELSYGINLNNNDDLSNCFYITDNDFKPIMDVIFKRDMDVLYIEPKEFDEIMLSQKMSYSEFQSAMLKSNVNSNIKNKYDFFKYLYETYVRNKKITCMIDDYDTKNNLRNLDDENILIASIATDKDNLIILSKKLSQNKEARRNLTFKFKKYLYKEKSLISYEKIKNKINKSLDIKEIMNDMLYKLDNFKM